MTFACSQNTLLAIFLIIFTFGTKQLLAWHDSDKIKLKDVTSLTLHKGEMTTGRRNSPVPQLKCVGGSAQNAYMPSVVQCYNKGFDGYDVQWECKAEMPAKFKLGKLQVTCEGYEYPNDPYILRGSCGLEYNLEYASSHYDSDDPKSQNSHFKFADLLLIAIVILLVYAVYISCTRRPSQQYQYSTTSDDDFPPDSDSWGYGDSRPSGPPPPPGFHYQSAPDSCSRPRYSSYNSGTSNYGGFWTGAATGGLLGYLFSRNSGSSTASHYSSAPRSTFSSSRNESSSTSTSFGGTSRR